MQAWILRLKKKMMVMILLNILAMKSQVLVWASFCDLSVIFIHWNIFAVYWYLSLFITCTWWTSGCVVFLTIAMYWILGSGRGAITAEKLSGTKVWVPTPGCPMPGQRLGWVFGAGGGRPLPLWWSGVVWGHHPRKICLFLPFWWIKMIINSNKN